MVYEPVEAYCFLVGTFLDVVGLERKLGVQVSAKSIRGKIAEHGVHKGKPTPYGGCNIEVPKNVAFENRIEWLADFIADNIIFFKEFGADDIEFCIIWRGVQGNMELSVNELKKISALNIPLIMNYDYIVAGEG